ncbi:MAG: hypothetical protein ACQES9_08260 [Myxococcota bacterium]
MRSNSFISKLKFLFNSHVIAYLIVFYFFFGLLIPVANTEQVSLTLDISALKAIAKKKLPSSINLSGPLSAQNIKLYKIKNGKIYGTFNLVFYGQIAIPTFLWKSRTITVKKIMKMDFYFIPELKKYTLFIPVNKIVVSRSGVKLPMSNNILGGVVKIKRWLFSNKGKSLLNKKFKISFKSILINYFGNKNWKTKITLQNNRVILKAET